MKARTSTARRTLILALSIGLLLAITSPAQGALNVLSKVRIASLQVFDDGRARIAFEYTCPDYDYEALATIAAVGQVKPGGLHPGASIPFGDEVVCDGTTQRLVKTVRSTSGEPYDPALSSSAAVSFSISSDSDPWPGRLYGSANDRFLPGGARLHFDIRFRRVWVNDLGHVKTRFTYTCPTGTIYDEEDLDTVKIRWGQVTSEGQPGGGIGQSRTLARDLVCDDTMHTVVKSSTDDLLFSPAFPIHVSVDLRAASRRLSVLPG